MATFSYRCRRLPVHTAPEFDATFRVGTAPATTACPTCGSDAVRVFSPPMISRAYAGARELLDRAERSTSEPDVVRALPADTGRQRVASSVNPAWSRLPRP
jgi:hypothetical protein